MRGRSMELLEEWLASTYATCTIIKLLPTMIHIDVHVLCNYVISLGLCIM